MYTSLHCFADDAQMRYRSIIAWKRYVVLIKDVCYIFKRKRKRERILVRERERDRERETERAIENDRMWSC